MAYHTMAMGYYNNDLNTLYIISEYPYSTTGHVCMYKWTVGIVDKTIVINV